MPTLSDAHAFNVSFRFTYTPVAVFVGGTGGIAASVADLLARYTEGKIHIIIAGRNRTDGAKVLDSLTKPLQFHDNEDSHIIREFVFCDASSLSSVRTASEDISTLLAQRLGAAPRINYLVFSAGYYGILSSPVTVDGIDLQLMMRYYHRFKMAFELMPLLRNARDQGQDAKFFSVLASGMKFPTDPNDFGYKNLGALGTAFKAIMTNIASAIYNDTIIEEFASRERGISFTHMYPGLVRTSSLDFSFRKHWLFKPFEPIFGRLLHALSVSAEDCGEWTVFALLNAKADGKGFYRRGAKGQELNVGDVNKPKRKLLREQLFEHSVSEMHAEELLFSPQQQKS